VGLDKNPVELNDPTNRIFIYQGNQEDKNILDKIRMETSKDGFDIIIDDASHIGELTKVSFWHLFDNHLKPGGVYVIEDWGTGYWRGWLDGEFCLVPPKDENHQFKSHQHGMVGFIKQLVDEQGMNDITKPNLGIKVPQRESKFQEMKISYGQVIITKSFTIT